MTFRQRLANRLHLIGFQLDDQLLNAIRVKTAEIITERDQKIIEQATLIQQLTEALNEMNAAVERERMILSAPVTQHAVGTTSTHPEPQIWTPTF